MGNDNIDQLREQTQGGSRLEDDGLDKQFISDLVDQFTDDSVSNSRKNITTNDPELWDVFQAFDENDERYTEFLDRVGIDERNPPRSVVLSKLARKAIRENDPRLKEEIDEASDEVNSGF